MILDCYQWAAYTLCVRLSGRQLLYVHTMLFLPNRAKRTLVSVDIVVIAEMKLPLLAGNMDMGRICPTIESLYVVFLFRIYPLHLSVTLSSPFYCIILLWNAMFPSYTCICTHVHTHPPTHTHTHTHTDGNLNIMTDLGIVELLLQALGKHFQVREVYWNHKRHSFCPKIWDIFLPPCLYSSRRMLSIM